MFARHKTILLILIGLVILFFAYWYFVLSKKDQAVTVNGVPSTTGLTRAIASPVSTSTDSRLEIDKKFVNGILTLNAVRIDTGLFSAPEYLALNFPDQPYPVDYDIPVGRVNPFLPIGVNGQTGIVPANVQQDKPIVSTGSSTPPVSSTSTPRQAQPQRLR